MLHIHGCCEDIEHAGQQCPELVREGVAVPFRLYGSNHREFGDEPVVFEGHLSVDTTREGVALQLLLQNSCGFVAPARALSKPVKGQRRHQEAGGFGNYVIVGRGSTTAETCKVLLVPPDLSTGDIVVFEELGCSAPSIEQPAHPDPGDQSDS